MVGRPAFVARDPKGRCMIASAHFGFGETGEIEPIAQFPFEELDEPAPEAEESSSMTKEQVETSLKLFGALVQWLWGRDSKSRQALRVRAVFASWLLLPEVRAHPLPLIVGQFDREKPNIGRLVADFKRRFPMVKVPHFKP